MISFILNSFPIKRKLILFADEPSLRVGLFDDYMQSFCTKVKFGYKRTPKYTKVVDISNDRFTENFCKQNLHKIHKAKSEGIICRSTSDFKTFIVFFNEFIEKKHLPGQLTEKELEVYGKSLIVRVASLKDGPGIVYHTYLCDNSIKRVRFFHSSSNIYDKTISSADRSLSGRANRYLVYDDMMYFKEQGFQTFDFGGYAYQTQNTSLKGINDFKDSFGGVLVEESNYEPFLFHIIKMLVTGLRKIISIVPPVGKEK